MTHGRATTVLPPPAPPLGPEACFIAHRSTVCRWACTLGADPQVAPDIVQEVFLRMLKSAPTFASAGAQLGWLRRVTANLVIDHRRAARPAMRLTGEVPQTERVPIGADAAVATAAMDQLSEMQRLVLVAKLADNLTFAQIAAELGVAVPTVKTHYLRALGAIRDRLGVGDSDPGLRSPVQRGVSS